MRLLRISALALTCGAAAYALPPAAFAGPDDHDPKSRLEHFCSDAKFGEKLTERQAKHADHLTERLKLTSAQKAAYKEVQDLRAKALTDGRTALCASKPGELSYEKRVEFRLARLQARLDAVKAETPKLLAFYNSLDERQKGQFEEISRHEGRGRPGGLRPVGPGGAAGDKSAGPRHDDDED
jgi:hypothetical protein